MKKKLQKKITLRKETLRDLSGHEMGGVAAGVFTATCCNSSNDTSLAGSCVGCDSQHCSFINTNCC